MKRLKTIIYGITAACVLASSPLFGAPAYSDEADITLRSAVVVGDAPDSSGGSLSGVEAPKEIPNGGGSGENNTGNAPAGPGENTPAEPGSAYQNEPAYSVDLGFTVISPSYEYNGFMVAEGSVALRDGSWAYIGHESCLRQPYYRWTGENDEWYAVASNATQFGNYYTPDGSAPPELWLKKSETVATDHIMLNTSDPVRQQIVKTALSLLGKAYSYAGSGPESFDCSGFVNYVMSAAGISTPRTSSEICLCGTQTDIAHLRPGDIVGRPGHVGIYIGNGNFAHSSGETTGVISDNVALYNSSAAAFTNYVNVVGD